MYLNQTYVYLKKSTPKTSKFRLARKLGAVHSWRRYSPEASTGGRVHPAGRTDVPLSASMFGAGKFHGRHTARPHTLALCASGQRKRTRPKARPL